MKSWCRVALVALTLVSVAHAWGSPPPSPVRHLTTSDFKEVTADGKVYFVKCGHCKRLAPTWETLAKEYEDNSDAEVVSVDCTKQKKICDGAKFFDEQIALQKGQTSA
ncbi:hypothetical protein QBZ16_004212 [Prototheca wickerhamii]|uniref:Thioredoxin domain-containing protein n=1 Tax=Prototheca wickerhamii TaxID=3111 RepID=A0AAD9IJU6_PROWI|nr:hypothetical protein QBZ16_004212 [Prototheca wickerhamii]